MDTNRQTPHARDPQHVQMFLALYWRLYWDGEDLAADALLSIMREFGIGPEEIDTQEAQQ